MRDALIAEEDKGIHQFSFMGSFIIDGCCCCWTTTCGGFGASSVLRAYDGREISRPSFSCSHVVKSWKNLAQCSAKRSRSKPRKRDDVVGIDGSLLDGDKGSNPADGSLLKADLALGDGSSLMGVSASPSSAAVPSRDAVLRACVVTSGLFTALGAGIRQVSHIASAEGLPIADCTKEVTFGFEIWHLELITGLVILVSSSRYLLLKIWPDFAESSEAANQQVLTSLDPLDYLLVAFLPGISEELLFRGALIPVIGLNWMSVLIVASLFGVLHLGSGRKYSFAIWATFVGLVYGWATITTGSIVAPMASHAVNNLVGGALWRFDSRSPK